MIQIDKELIENLFEKAKLSERNRMNYDLRTSSNDGSQRMLNALLPDSVVPIHRHPHSNENVLCLCGKIVEVLYKASPQPSPKGEGELIETERIHLDPTIGNFGCVVPANTWHTVEVIEPSVIYEAKDGKYREDGSESWDDYKTKNSQNPSADCNSPSLSANSMSECSNVDLARQPQNNQTVCCTNSQSAEDDKPSPSAKNIPDNSTGDLKQQITYLIGMERQSGSMDNCTPLYISRMLNVPLEEVEKVMKTLYEGRFLSSSWSLCFR